MTRFKKAVLASFTVVMVSAFAAPATVQAEPPTKPSPRFSAKTKPVAANPVPCTCRFQGDDYKFGQTICIRGKQATCDRVLNNTSWQFSEKPCLFMSLLDDRASSG